MGKSQIRTYPEPFKTVSITKAVNQAVILVSPFASRDGIGQTHPKDTGCSNR